MGGFFHFLASLFSGSKNEAPVEEAPLETCARACETEEVCEPTEVLECGPQQVQQKSKERRAKMTDLLKKVQQANEALETHLNLEQEDRGEAKVGP